MSLSLFGVMLGHPSAADLDAAVEQAARSPVSYSHVGSTLGSPGRPLKRAQLDIGHGPAAFERAIAGLRMWVPQRGIGARVHPPDAPIAEGTTVIVVLALGPFTVLAPDRIVRVIDEPGCFAFSYGTLAGHAERGEETFLLELLEDGTVRFTLIVDAVPATVAARLAAPAVKLAQRHALHRYLRALAEYVASERPT